MLLSVPTFALLCVSAQLACEHSGCSCSICRGGCSLPSSVRVDKQQTAQSSPGSALIAFGCVALDEVLGNMAHFLPTCRLLVAAAPWEGCGRLMQCLCRHAAAGPLPCSQILRGSDPYYSDSDSDFDSDSSCCGSLNACSRNACGKVSAAGCWFQLMAAAALSTPATGLDDIVVLASGPCVWLFDPFCLAALNTGIPLVGPLLPARTLGLTCAPHVMLSGSLAYLQRALMHQNELRGRVSSEMAARTMHCGKQAASRRRQSRWLGSSVQKTTTHVSTYLEFLRISWMRLVLVGTSHWACMGVPMQSGGISRIPTTE
eukprot:364663-Chlamydomonas_euryale.AAC.3